MPMKLIFWKFVLLKAPTRLTGSFKNSMSQMYSKITNSMALIKKLHPTLYLKSFSILQASTLLSLNEMLQKSYTAYQIYLGFYQTIKQINFRWALCFLTWISVCKMQIKRRYPFVMLRLSVKIMHQY